MSAESRSAWDAESLQKIRLVGDRRYRRTLGLLSLGALLALAVLGLWVIDFRAYPVTVFLGYWVVVLAVFLVTIFLVVVDYWSVRLEFAVKRHELAQEFLQQTRAAAAPRNGKPRIPEPPHL